MTDPLTPLLTVEDLLQMVTKRDALLRESNQITEQIDHIRQFLGEERFNALVGIRDAVKATHSLPVSRRGRVETTVRDIILRAIPGKSEGLSYEELRDQLEAAGLQSRAPNTFFNTIARMTYQKELVKLGERDFDPGEFAKLTPDQISDLEGALKVRGGTKAITDVLAGSEGMAAAEVIAAMAKSHSSLKSGAIYATLSRLSLQGVLKRDEQGRYSLASGNDRQSA